MADTPTASRAPEPPVGPKSAVLLVDDQPANLTALRAILDGLGPDLVEARSGEEAPERLRDRAFAVVLLDVRLGHLDVFEAARLIRARAETRATPITFLTAYEIDRDLSERDFTPGAVDFDDHLVKPPEPQAVEAGFADLPK